MTTREMPFEVVRVLIEDAIMIDATGSKDSGFQKKLLNDVVRCLSAASLSDEGQDLDRAQKTVLDAALAALRAFRAKDEIEGMIAAQCVALHAASMECFRRAMLPQQPSEVASRLRKDGANLARAMTDMIEALDRKRGKGPQVVRVERVMVADGGRAVIGNFVTGGVAAAPSAMPLPIERGPASMDLMTERKKWGAGGED